MRYGLIVVGLASALSVGFDIAVRPVARGETLAAPWPKQTDDVMAEIARLRSQADVQNTANVDYRQQISALIEAQDFAPVEALIPPAVTSGTEAVQAIQAALSLSQSLPDESLTAELYGQLTEYYGNLGAVYDLQAQAYGAQNLLEQQLLAQQRNLQIQTQQLDAILPSQNETLIVTSTVGLTILQWSIGQTHQQLGQNLDAIDASELALEL
ncbi:MAG: hypothetical protein AAFU84_08525, partial [Cyanobacteria bacterium J06633_23]